MPKRARHKLSRMNEGKKIQVYLDYNASTPIDSRVIAAMRECMETAYGNPSSPHWAGLPAKKLVERARKKVAGLLGCEPDEVVFTSGGSESNNMVLKGVYYASEVPHPHIITSSIEHPAIVEPCRFLQRMGAKVTWLPVDAFGSVDPDTLRRAIDSNTVLVSIMHANSEVGTIQPVRECAKIAHQSGVPFHTDAAQSVGKIPTDVNDLDTDYLSIAAHKIYAPKGIGALYIRKGSKLEPLIHGAGHENGRRAGTQSAVMATALGEACQLASELPGVQLMSELKNRLKQGLKEAFGKRLEFNGHPQRCLPNTLHVSFLDYTGSELLARVPEIAASTGSACHAGQVEMSAVLEAMGITRQAGAGAVRFSLGRSTTADQIDYVVNRLARIGNAQVF